MLQKIIGVAGTLLLLFVSLLLLLKVHADGILVIQAGNWRAPFGISLVIDLFSGIMLFVSGIIGVCVAVYSLTMIDKQRHSYMYFVFFHGILMGVNGAFLTGDVFNFYVWIEVMLMASFGMIMLGGEKLQLEGAIKYMSLNIISSLFFLAGTGILYGLAGTLNMAELSVSLPDLEKTPMLNAATSLFFIALGIKAALFPFFYWLPSSYHTPPVAVTALFAGLLTKVGVYALIRFFTLFFVQDGGFWHQLFIVVAGFTMVIGVLTAASQMDTRRILSFHIISQIGYMIMGLGIFTVLSIGGAIYFMAHNIVAKTNAFLVMGVMNKKVGSFNLKDLGNLYRLSPLLAFFFMVPALALAGIPPLSGFFGKFLLIKAGFIENHFIITGISLIVSLLTLFSMIKIWNNAFWRDKKYEEPVKSHGTSIGFSMFLPVAILAAISIFMGIFAGPVIELCMNAAEQLMEPASYIEAVLGNERVQVK
jgi:multicomponent Na+:H+ antiporter subunit D